MESSKVRRGMRRTRGSNIENGKRRQRRRNYDGNAESQAGATANSTETLVRNNSSSNNKVLYEISGCGTYDFVSNQDGQGIAGADGAVFDSGDTGRISCHGEKSFEVDGSMILRVNRRATRGKSIRRGIQCALLTLTSAITPLVVIYGPTAGEGPIAVSPSLKMKNFTLSRGGGGVSSIAVEADRVIVAGVSGMETAKTMAETTVECFLETFCSIRVHFPALLAFTMHLSILPVQSEPLIHLVNVLENCGVTTSRPIQSDPFQNSRYVDACLNEEWKLDCLINACEVEPIQSCSSNFDNGDSIPMNYVGLFRYGSPVFPDFLAIPLQSLDVSTSSSQLQQSSKNLPQVQSSVVVNDTIGVIANLDGRYGAEDLDNFVRMDSNDAKTSHAFTPGNNYWDFRCNLLDVSCENDFLSLFLGNDAITVVGESDNEVTRSSSTCVVLPNERAVDFVKQNSDSSLSDHGAATNLPINDAATPPFQTGARYYEEEPFETEKSSHPTNTHPGCVNCSVLFKIFVSLRGEIKSLQSPLENYEWIVSLQETFDDGMVGLYTEMPLNLQCHHSTNRVLERSCYSSNRKGVDSIGACFREIVQFACESTAMFIVPQSELLNGTLRHRQNEYCSSRRRQHEEIILLASLLRTEDDIGSNAVNATRQTGDGNETANHWRIVDRRLVSVSVVLEKEVVKFGRAIYDVKLGGVIDVDTTESGVMEYSNGCDDFLRSLSKDIARIWSSFNPTVDEMYMMALLAVCFLMMIVNQARRPQEGVPFVKATYFSASTFADDYPHVNGHGASLHNVSDIGAQNMRGRAYYPTNGGDNCHPDATGSVHDDGSIIDDDGNLCAASQCHNDAATYNVDGRPNDGFASAIGTDANFSVDNCQYSPSLFDQSKNQIRAATIANDGGYDNASKAKTDVDMSCARPANVEGRPIPLQNGNHLSRNQIRNVAAARDNIDRRHFASENDSHMQTAITTHDDAGDDNASEAKTDVALSGGRLANVDGRTMSLQNCNRVSRNQVQNEAAARDNTHRGHFASKNESRMQTATSATDGAGDDNASEDNTDMALSSARPAAFAGGAVSRQSGHHLSRNEIRNVSAARDNKAAATATDSTGDKYAYIPNTDMAMPGARLTNIGDRPVSRQNGNHLSMNQIRKTAASNDDITGHRNFAFESKSPRQTAAAAPYDTWGDNAFDTNIDMEVSGSRPANIEFRPISHQNGIHLSRDQNRDLTASHDNRDLGSFDSEKKNHVNSFGDGVVAHKTSPIACQNFSTDHIRNDGKTIDDENETCENLADAMSSNIASEIPVTDGAQFSRNRITVYDETFRHCAGNEIQNSTDSHGDKEFAPKSKNGVDGLSDTQAARQSSPRTHQYEIDHSMLRLQDATGSCKDTIHMNNSSIYIGACVDLFNNIPANKDSTNLARKKIQGANTLHGGSTQYDNNNTFENDVESFGNRSIDSLERQFPQLSGEYVNHSPKNDVDEDKNLESEHQSKDRNNSTSEPLSPPEISRNSIENSPFPCYESCENMKNTQCAFLEVQECVDETSTGNNGTAEQTGNVVDTIEMYNDGAGPAETWNSDTATIETFNNDIRTVERQHGLRTPVTNPPEIRHIREFDSQCNRVNGETTNSPSTLDDAHAPAEAVHGFSLQKTGDNGPSRQARHATPSERPELSRIKIEPLCCSLSRKTSRKEIICLSPTSTVAATTADFAVSRRRERFCENISSLGQSRHERIDRPVPVPSGDIGQRKKFAASPNHCVTPKETEAHQSRTEHVRTRSGPKSFSFQPSSSQRSKHSSERSISKEKVPATTTIAKIEKKLLATCKKPAVHKPSSYLMPLSQDIERPVWQFSSNHNNI